jgi:hypothetical protein
VGNFEIEVNVMHATTSARQRERENEKKVIPVEAVFLL